MGELLSFGQGVVTTSLWHRKRLLFVTDAMKSFFTGHDWQYGCRADTWGYWGAEWFDEMDLMQVDDEMNEWTAALMQGNFPTEWPPSHIQAVGRRLGIWGSNGANPNLDLMLSWQPGAITTIYDYLSVNGIEYLQEHPEVPCVIRFLHPQNWPQDPQQSAKDLANQVINKWSTIIDLNPYVYFANELNLGPESGSPEPALESRDFYEQAGAWIGDVAQRIKNAVPEMRLVTPPFAFGHREDGEWSNGKCRDGWAGYDYLWVSVRDYFDNTLTFHGYWGDGRGCLEDRLYHPELSTWYAFRWRRVLDLFKVRYGLDCRMIIDECGNMNPAHPGFFDQLKYYAEECLSDERVIAVTPFLWFDATNNPGNVINSWVQNIPDLEGFCTKLAALPDVAIIPPASEPEPQPGPEPIPEPPEPEPPEPMPEPRPKMHIEYVKGYPVIKGAWPRDGAEIIYTDPWSNQLVGKTGFKVEPGLEMGGFSFPAYGGQTHSLDIENYYYEVFVKPDHAAILSFTEGAPPEPEPEPPEPEPEVLYRLVSRPMTKEEAEVIAGQHPDIFKIEEY